MISGVSFTSVLNEFQITKKDIFHSIQTIAVDKLTQILNCMYKIEKFFINLPILELRMQTVYSQLPHLEYFMT